MKKLKGTFMVLIVIVTLVCFVNFGYVGKETKAYSINDTVFASGMDLLFAQPYFTSWSGRRVNDTSRPYAQVLLDISVYENNGFPQPVTNPYTGPELTWGRYGKALEFNPDAPQTFYSLSSDGYTFNSNNTYLDGWNDGNADLIFDNITVIRVGQSYNIALGYYFYRTYLFFDTSTVDESLTIDSVTLRLYGQSNNSQTDFNVTIQNGQPTYPHIPIITSDYNRSHYSGNGGQFDTSSIILNGWNDIELTNTSWVNATGTTKLTLRSDREINGTVPTQQEYVTFPSGESSYPPQLIVEYAVDNYVEIPDDDSLDDSDEITFMAWINPSKEVVSTTANHILVSKHSNYRHGIFIKYTEQPNKFMVFFNNGAKTSIAEYEIPSYDTWYHVTGVFNGTNALLYINSELVDVGSTITGGTSGDNNQPVRIGGGVANRYSSAIIDEVRIYPFELTGSHIRNDMLTPMNEFRSYGFYEALNFTGAPLPTPIEWRTDDFAGATGFVNNDPTLPFVEMPATGDYGFRKTYLQYVAGFSSYRMYASLKWTGNATGMILWDWTFFKNGIAQRTFAVEVAPLESYWQVRYSSNGMQLRTLDLYNTTNPFDVIVDAWIGDDNKHFTIRVTTSEPVSQGDNSLTYGYDLEDINNVTRRIEWFDGWVLTTVSAMHIASPNYNGDRMEIVEHGMIFIGWAIILVIGIVASYLAYEFIVAPVLQETTGIPFPSVLEPNATVQNATTLWANIAHELGSIFYSVGQSIVNALSPIVTAIANVAGPLIQAFINFMGDIVTALLNFAMTLWDFIVTNTDALIYAIFPGAGQTAFSDFIAGVAAFLAGLVGWIIVAFTNIVTFLTSTFDFLGSFIGKMLNTISTAVGQWVIMIQSIFSMISGGYGQTYNIFVDLNLSVWITIIAILYPVYLMAIWDQKGIDGVINHLNMVFNILAWIGRIFITVIQLFITVITSIIESVPIVE